MKNNNSIIKFIKNGIFFKRTWKKERIRGVKCIIFILWVVGKYRLKVRYTNVMYSVWIISQLPCNHPWKTGRFNPGNKPQIIYIPEFNNEVENGAAYKGSNEHKVAQPQPSLHHYEVTNLQQAKMKQPGHFNHGNKPQNIGPPETNSIYEVATGASIGSDKQNYINITTQRQPSPNHYEINSKNWNRRGNIEEIKS